MLLLLWRQKFVELVPEASGSSTADIVGAEVELLFDAAGTAVADVVLTRDARLRFEVTAGTSTASLFLANEGDLLLWSEGSTQTQYTVTVTHPVDLDAAGLGTAELNLRRRLATLVLAADGTVRAELVLDVLHRLALQAKGTATTEGSLAVEFDLLLAAVGAGTLDVSLALTFALELLAEGTSSALARALRQPIPVWVSTSVVKNKLTLSVPASA